MTGKIVLVRLNDTGGGLAMALARGEDGQKYVVLPQDASGLQLLIGDSISFTPAADARGDRAKDVLFLSGDGSIAPPLFKPIEYCCRDCGKAFIFTAEDQQCYFARRFRRPNRCLVCRRAGRRTRLNESRAARGAR